MSAHEQIEVAIRVRVRVRPARLWLERLTIRVRVRVSSLGGTGGDLFAQQYSESGPRGIRTHTISANLYKKRHANR